MSLLLGLGDALFEQVAREKQISNEVMSALHLLYQHVLQGALELVDDRVVAKCTCSAGRAYHRVETALDFDFYYSLFVIFIFLVFFILICVFIIIYFFLFFFVYFFFF